MKNHKNSFKSYFFDFFDVSFKFIIALYLYNNIYRFLEAYLTGYLLNSAVVTCLSLICILLKFIFHLIAFYLFGRAFNVKISCHKNDSKKGKSKFTYTEQDILNDKLHSLDFSLSITINKNLWGYIFSKTNLSILVYNSFNVITFSKNDGNYDHNYGYSVIDNGKKVIITDFLSNDSLDGRSIEKTFPLTFNIMDVYSDCIYVDYSFSIFKNRKVPKFINNFLGIDNQNLKIKKVKEG